MHTLSIDHGAGNMKLFGDCAVLVPSRVAVVSGETLSRVAGLHTTRPPLRIRLNGHQFYVGDTAHDWGRPVENLDNSRFVTGSPDTIALTYAALTAYMQAHGANEMDNVAAIVGLPQSALTEDAAKQTAHGLRSWLRTEHTWHADGLRYSANITDVKTTSQTVGALFDYLLDDAGEYIAARKAEFKREIAVVSIGMNTLELQVTEAGTIKQRFTDSETLGVRRLLELCDPQGFYSRGEMDAALRARTLDYKNGLPVWASEISGRLEQRWGKALRRFARVIIVGGGALLLQQALTTQFEGREWIPDNPLMAVARGLHKFSLRR